MEEIAVACTGGGKAVISIGVIRALEELGIKINAISGASMGACVAILYAMGYTPKEMLDFYKKYAKAFGRFTAGDVLCAVPSLAFRGGLRNPKPIPIIVDAVCRDRGFVKMSDFNMPVIIPTLDITKRETVYYSSRPIKDKTYHMERSIAEAIRSTTSLPVIFVPNKVKIDYQIHHMVDGGTTTNIPVLPLKQFSDRVLGIEAKYYNTKERQRINFFTGFTETFQAMRRSAHSYQKEGADLWLEIDVQRTGMFASEKAMEYCEECGYQAMMELIKTGYLEKKK